MKVFGLALVALLAFGGAAHAQRFSALTGGKLGNLCTGNDRNSTEACTAYIDGIADGVGFYQRLMPSDGSHGKLPDYVCIPTSATGVQLRNTFVAWLRQHAEAQKQAAAQAVMRSLNDTFKCEGEH